MSRRLFFFVVLIEFVLLPATKIQPVMEIADQITNRSIILLVLRGRSLAVVSFDQFFMDFDTSYDLSRF